jgi:excisionase family DNA binding protein
MNTHRVGPGASAEGPENARDSPDAPRAARPEARPGERPESAGGHSERLWDVAEVAAYLRLSADAVYKMTARRASVRIPCIRIGGKLRFRRYDIDHWLTLLTVSNLDVLMKMQRKVSQVSHGYDPQAKTE